MPADERTLPANTAVQKTNAQRSRAVYLALFEVAPDESFASTTDARMQRDGGGMSGPAAPTAAQAHPRAEPAQ